MSPKPIEKGTIQLSQALAELPPPARQSPAIVQRVEEILSTSPRPRLELEELQTRAWSLYVDQRDQRQVNIYNNYTYNITSSFNSDCWKDDHSDSSTTSTTTTTTDPNWAAGTLCAAIALGLTLMLSQVSYTNGARDQMIRQGADYAP